MPRARGLSGTAHTLMPTILRPTPSPRNRPPLGDAAFWCALALALLSCLPVLVARYPQMSDYPAHLARYHVMLEAGANPIINRFYGFTWQWTGNLGVDILIRPFAALFGLETGGRVIVGLIAVLTGLGIIAVDIALRRRVTVGSFFAFPLIWAPMLLTGLINFALGQAVALWVFALWVVLEGRSWRWAVFLPIGLVVWLCHLSAWGMLCVMVLGYAWNQRHNAKALLDLWPLALPLIPLLFGHWLFGAGTSGDFSYGPNWIAFKQAIWVMAMRDTYYWLDRISPLIVGLCLLAAVLWQRVDGRLVWGAVMLLALSILMPRHISGGDFADYRMITAGLLVSCLAVNWNIKERASRWAVAAACALYLVRLAVTTLSWQADSAQTGRMLQALDHLPRGCKVASYVLVPGGSWPLDHFEHIGAYAALRNDCLTNANFAVPHIHMLHLKVPFAVDPSQRMILGDDKPVDLAHFAPADQADYLWYVGGREPDSLPAGAVVEWRGDHTLVARLAKPGEPG